MEEVLIKKEKLSIAQDTAEWLKSDLDLTQELQILATQEVDDTELNGNDLAYHFSRTKTFTWVMLDRIADMAKKAEKLVELLYELT